MCYPADFGRGHEDLALLLALPALKPPDSLKEQLFYNYSNKFIVCPKANFMQCHKVFVCCVVVSWHVSTSDLPVGLYLARKEIQKRGIPTYLFGEMN